MRRALAEDFASLHGVRVVMTLDARLPDEPGPWTVVRVGPGEEPDTFARLASEADYTLCVAPETDGVLEARARLIESVGGRSLGSLPEAISLCGDKLRLEEHFRAHGIPTPRSVRVAPSQGLPHDFPYPAVLKPIDGVGSLNTFYVESATDVPVAALVMNEALLQPFVPGVPLSASFLIDSSGHVRWMGIGRQIVSRHSGRFAYEGGFVPHPITGQTSELLRAVQSVPGLHGWIGVDFVWDESNGITLLEINPRVTTSYVGWRSVHPSAHAIAEMWLGRIRSLPIVDDGNPLTPIIGSARFSADGRVEHSLSTERPISTS